MKLKYLLKNIRYDICFNYDKKEKDLDIKGIYLDSKKVSKDSIFICNIQTIVESINSHYLIDEAIKKGASIVFLNYYVSCIRKYNYVIFYICKFLPMSYSFLFLNIFSFFKNKIIFVGITGTNGKTTNCCYIYKYLNDLFFNSILSSTIGIFKKKKKVFSSNFTTLDSSFLYGFLESFVKKENIFLVLENSSHSLSLYRNHCLKFDVFSLTNISSDHLDFHFDNKDYILAKKNINYSIKNNGFLILNYDYKKHFKKFKNLIFWDNIKNKNSDVFLSQIVDFYYYKKITINILGKNFFFITKFYGLLNLNNILSFITSILPLNFNKCILYRTINNLFNIQGRFNRIHINYFFNFPIIFIDFAHNSKSLFNFLNYIKKNLNKKIISVTGLGGQRDFLKRFSFLKILSKYSYYTIITADNTRNESIASIYKDLLNNRYFFHKYCVILNRVIAIKKSIELSDFNSIVLIIGRGNEKKINLDSNFLNFNDLDAIINFLKKYYE